MERLDRYLAHATGRSRSEVKKLIKEGRVLVNESADVKPETAVDPQRDIVCLDGEKISRKDSICLMMNKPAGVISATKDGREKTVIDLVDSPYARSLFPAGRLDKDTEGLLLLTDDGKLSHNLLSPSKHITKTYFAVVSGSVDETLCRQFLEGIDIGEKKKTKPAGLIHADPEDLSGEEGTPISEEGLPIFDEGACRGLPDEAWMRTVCRAGVTAQDYARCGEGESCCVITLTEGKFHQIKRMFAAYGREVLYLKRIAMGHLILDTELEPGCWRELTAEERALLTDRGAADTGADERSAH